MDGVTVLLLIAAGVYLAPGLLAVLFRHRHRWLVLVVNVLLGWTVLGWFFAWGLAIYPLTWQAQLLDEVDQLRAELEAQRQQR
jgi:predicted membrane channel-forming protein YqfA (hemolysin III family)